MSKKIASLLLSETVEIRSNRVSTQQWDQTLYEMALYKWLVSQIKQFYSDLGYTPPRTPRISGLKSQILTPTFLS